MTATQTISSVGHETRWDSHSYFTRYTRATFSLLPDPLLLRQRLITYPCPNLSIVSQERS
jgi:hypothetical protein